jgi:hypothetical protein
LANAAPYWTLETLATRLANKFEQAETVFNGVVKITGTTDLRARHKRGVFRNKEGRLAGGCGLCRLSKVTMGRPERRVWCFGVVNDRFAPEAVGIE